MSALDVNRSRLTPRGADLLRSEPARCGNQSECVASRGSS